MTYTDTPMSAFRSRSDTSVGMQIAAYFAGAVIGLSGLLSLAQFVLAP